MAGVAGSAVRQQAEECNVKGLGLPSILVAATLTAGSLLVPSSAQAGGPPQSAESVTSRMAMPSAPCQPDGVTAADDAVADRLRPLMNGRRLGRAVSGYNISCARAIVNNVKARGLGERAAVIAVTAAVAESILRNYTVASDHDSLGLFQQRPSQGWGQPGQLVDPRYATHKFLNAMIRKHPAGGWQTGAIGEICQRVQGSGFPAAYAPEVHDASLIVATLWPLKADPAVGAAPKDSAPAAPKKPTGPFQRSLIAAVTSRGLTESRHDVSMADWNGDRRLDLVTVQRSGTVTGRTEVSILDGTPTVPGGASSFQRLLLHTATALGPTDDRYAFSVADWNGDGRPDLVAIQKSGAASGRTEVQVIDGASNFQTVLVNTATVMGPTDDRYAFSMADGNGDGRLDLVVVQKSGTASGRTEVRVLNGASSFGDYLAEIVTALGPTDNRHDVSVADWNGDERLDLVMVQKSGTASRRTEVRVLDGASNLNRTLVQKSTAEGPTDERHDLSVADWNGDGQLDLVVVQNTGTASGRTEVRILAG